MKSYVMVKPEFASKKKVINYVKDVLKNAGIEIEYETYINYDKAHAEKHYAVHKGKSFYDYLIKYITSDKAYGMVVNGDDNVIDLIRSICGSTKNPNPGTIRYDVPKMLGIEPRITENVVHSSDSEENAKQEIDIFMDLVNKQDIKSL